ncbi:GIY-YIG nuclease family protein [Sphaerimonospora cavernae]|uniref:GIY-YIG nuclease family protein n=1 Tax=Sphaerimonospora cavernae TaxID=1740611 RepID=A0ABV6UA88_9ACTN
MASCSYSVLYGLNFRQSPNRKRRAPLPAGFVYALELSTGIIKVGKTDDWERRLGEHTRDCLKRGVTIIRHAHVLVADADSAEDDLIHLVGRELSRTGAGREYFHGDFSTARRALSAFGQVQGDGSTVMISGAYNEMLKVQYSNYPDPAWIVEMVSEARAKFDEIKVFCDSPDVDTVEGAIGVAGGWVLAESLSFEEWLRRMLDEDEDAIEEHFDNERAAGDTVLLYQRDTSERPVQSTARAGLRRPPHRSDPPAVDHRVGHAAPDLPRRESMINNLLRRLIGLKSQGS